MQKMLAMIPTCNDFLNISEEGGGAEGWKGWPLGSVLNNLTDSFFSAPPPP